MTDIISQVFKVLTLYLLMQVKAYAHNALNRFRRFARGALCVLASILFWCIGFILLFFSLFFYFAGNTELILPGVWSALISMGIGLVITVSGIWMMKKGPKQSSRIPEDHQEKHPGREYTNVFLGEMEKLIDIIASGFKKHGDSGSQGIKEDGKTDNQTGGSWLYALLLFVVGFIAGIIVSRIKRKTDPSGNIPDAHADNQSNGTTQK